MEKKIKLAFLSILAGLVIISCSLPALVIDRLQEFLNWATPTQPSEPSPTPIKTPQSEVEATPQEQDIQVVDKMRFEEGDEPMYEIDGIWPNLDGPEAIVSPFNAKCDQLIQGITNDFITFLGEVPNPGDDQGEPPLSSLTFNYEITYSDQRIFSFLLTFEQYIALSAHPFPFSLALNYDAQNAASLRLEELFLPEVDYFDEIGRLIDPILESKGFGYIAGTAADMMRQRENWNMLAEGLQFNFDVYEVGFYAAGPQHIIIPWVDLVGILDPNSPAGRVIEE